MSIAIGTCETIQAQASLEGRGVWSNPRGTDEVKTVFGLGMNFFLLL